MRPPRRGRRLSTGELRLWDAIAKLVTPLPGRGPAILEAAPETPAPPVDLLAATRSAAAVAALVCLQP